MDFKKKYIKKPKIPIWIFTKLFAILYALYPFFLEARPGYFAPWGTDIELVYNKHPVENPPPRDNPLHTAFENIILFHQKYINQVDGPRSHFRPTSSRYMMLSLRRYGLLKGYIRGCDRLLRENSELWVYRTRVINGKTYKWDPTI